MADIDIVQPVEGAERVVFDYTAAGNALDALSSMASRLMGQAEARVGPRDHAIVEWEGRYRNEFDDSWGQLQFSFSAAVESTGARSTLIYGAIDEANARQRALNTEAEEAATPVPAPR